MHSNRRLGGENIGGEVRRHAAAAKQAWDVDEYFAGSAEIF